MMLPDDPADSFGLRTVVVIRAKLPSDFAGGFGNDENNVGFAAVHDDIVGMETLVARVIPFVRAEHGHGVDVHPVAHAFGLRLAVVGVAGEGVLGAFAEAHFVEMLVAVPFPHDVAVPVHFEDHVVEKLLVGNLGIAGVAVREHKRIAGVGLGLHAGRVVAGGAAFALVVVVAAGHPAAGDAGIFDVFVAVELPDHVSVPVNLHEIEAVLHAVAPVTGAARGHEVAAGENLVREAVHAFPNLVFAAVHVHEHGAHFQSLKDREAVPALFGIIYGDAGRIDSRVTHDVLLIGFSLSIHERRFGGCCP